MRASICVALRLVSVVAALVPVPSAFAQQIPWGQPNTPISSHDRVYAADQTSNTVSVIDPSSNKLLGVIRLGDPVPGALSPLYIRTTPRSWSRILARLENPGCGIDRFQFCDVGRYGHEQIERHHLRWPVTS